MRLCRHLTHKARDSQYQVGKIRQMVNYAQFRVSDVSREVIKLEQANT